MKFKINILRVILILSSCFYSNLGYADAASDGMRAYLNNDYVKAFPLLKEAALNGNIVSQYLYGSMLYLGHIGNPNEMEGIGWIGLAAKQGLPDAQYRYAIILFKDGGSESMKEGIVWLKKAAEQGHEKALEFIRDIENKRAEQDRLSERKPKMVIDNEKNKENCKLQDSIIEKMKRNFNAAIDISNNYDLNMRENPLYAMAEGFTNGSSSAYMRGRRERLMAENDKLSDSLKQIEAVPSLRCIR